jgi:hypothetical protein
MKEGILGDFDAESKIKVILTAVMYEEQSQHGHR